MNTVVLLKSLQTLEKRAERGSDVIATYVDSGGLLEALLSRENGVVYGRRGTGKTHGLKYLEETERRAGNFVLYVDCERDLGSTEGLYNDTSLGLAYRATRLLVDVLNKIHERLISDAFDGPLSSQLETIDKMCDHFGDILVVEESEEEIQGGSEDVSQLGLSAEPVFSASPSFKLSANLGSASKVTSGRRLKTTGPVRTRVHIGAFASLLEKVVKAHPAKRFWLLFDEWSSIPLELQPYLAEMLRRLVFGIPKVTVRIAAIPHRTEWRIRRANGSYLGVEVGAELFPLLDLDEFVVFAARSRAEQATRSTDFFKRLLARHLNQAMKEEGISDSLTPDEMVRLLFIQITSLQEVVRAAEGVPRDALAIVARAALRAGSRPINTTDVRNAAAQVYQTTKQALLNGSPEARRLLDVIIDEVISKKKARAFLLNPDHVDHPLVRQLIDERILHVIKRGYSSKDQPGVRFDVLQIDYGCYVQLLNTKNAPVGLFGGNLTDDDLAMQMLFSEDEFNVPEDDYRAIRRAVLDLPEALTRVGITNSAS